MAEVPKSGQAEAQSERTLLELTSKLDIYSEPVTVRKTGIICTIGPSCNTVPVLKDLINAGMCVARLNFSHGDHEYHGKTAAAVRQAATELGVPLAIALDTKGPEIRTGLLEDFAKDPRAEVQLVAGSKVLLTSDPAFKEKCSKSIIYVDYDELWHSVAPGRYIYIDDGLISLQVDSTEPGKVMCTVVNDGDLGSKKGVNLPNSPVKLPAISEKDRADLIFAVEQGWDMVFASFTRRASDIHAMREVLGPKGKDMWIIAKIENHEGMHHFDEILQAADGIMVARGDLGIEIPAEKVFLAQKMMISRCNIYGKPVICATQMLESMIKAPRPTRAEGSDVANAVLDGSDCVMLSGETAKGNYPVLAVQTMAKICREAESAFFYKQLHHELSEIHVNNNMSMTETCAVAAVNASIFQKATAIVCLTTSGQTAAMLAKWRPVCPVLAVTRYERICRLMRLHRGVHTILCTTVKAPEASWMQDVDDRFALGVNTAKSMGIVKKGDFVIGVHGWQGGSGNTNTIRILQV
eukprot:m.172369 g.172369  ORF g.172369 m.172369 type:complete len:523 (+) comp17293_c2_seq1:2681-4249(+)